MDTTARSRRKSGVAGPSITLREQHRLLKKPPERRTAEELRMIASTLVGVSFFDRLEPAVRLQCCGVLRHQFIKADRTVFEEGDAGTLFYVVLEGQVGVYIRDMPADELEHSNNLEEMRRKRASERQKAQQTRLKKRLSLALNRGSVVISKRVISGISRWRERIRHDSEEGECTDGVHQVGFAEDVSDAGSGSEIYSGAGSDTESEEEVLEAPVAHSSAEEPAPLKEVASLRQGMAFGEIALENDQPRTATVRTTAPTHFAVLERADYQSILTHAFEQDRRERLEFLASTSLFANTPLEELAKISPMLHQRDLRKNDVVYEAGSDTLQVYFVRHGEFAVRRPMQSASAKPQISSLATNASAGRPSSADHGDTVPAISICRSRRTTMVGAASLAGGENSASSMVGALSRRSTLPARASICTGRKSLASSGVAALVAAAGVFASNADEIRGSRRNSRVLGPGDLPRSSLCRPKRSHWCTVTLVTSPQVFGMSDYLCGSRIHGDRVVCQSSTGCVYGILAKELMSHLNAETRARMMLGASAHDQFIKRRTHVLSELALISRSSSAGGCNVYSPQGRLNAITAALEKLSQEDEKQQTPAPTDSKAADSHADITSSADAKKRHSSRNSLQLAIGSGGYRGSLRIVVQPPQEAASTTQLLHPHSKAPHEQPMARRPATAVQVPQLRQTWHLEERLDRECNNTFASLRGTEAVASRAAAAHFSAWCQDKAIAGTNALDLPWLHDPNNEDVSSHGVSSCEAGAFKEKKKNVHISREALKDLDLAWLSLFRKPLTQQSPSARCACIAPPGKIADSRHHHQGHPLRRHRRYTQAALEMGLATALNSVQSPEPCVASKAPGDSLPGHAGPQGSTAPEQQAEATAQQVALPRLLGSKALGKADMMDREKPSLAEATSLSKGAKQDYDVYAVGSQMDVWSKSSKAWCPGHVEKVEDDQAYLVLKLPCGATARKVVSTKARASKVVPSAPSAGAVAAALLLREIAAASNAGQRGKLERGISSELFSEELLASAPRCARDSLILHRGQAPAESAKQFAQRASSGSSLAEAIELGSVYSPHRGMRPCP